MRSLSLMLAVAAIATIPFSAGAVDMPAKTETRITAPAPKKLTTQQKRMGLCSKEAKVRGLKKAERTAFMKSCLKKGSKVVFSKGTMADKQSGSSGKPVKPAPAPQ